MNYPPCYINDAVPNRRSLPPDVTGLVVPGLYPYNAVLKLALLLPVTGRFVPGL
jgi:hypothetical protein